EASYGLNRINGFPGSEGAVGTGDVLGAYKFGGWSGSSVSEGTAKIEAKAEEFYSTFAQGTSLAFWTTPLGSSTPANTFTLRESGSMVLAPLGSAPGAGTLGEMYVDAGLGTLFFNNGTGWTDIGASDVYHYETNPPGAKFQVGHARGTKASPIEVQSGDELGTINFTGYDNSFTDFLPGVQITALAKESFLGAQGSSLTIATTTLGGTIPQPRIVIDENGDVGVGSLLPISTFSVTKVGELNFTLENYDNTLTNILKFRRAQGTDVSPFDVQSNDKLGTLEFFGKQAAQWDMAASITGEVDGAPGGPGNMPGRITFGTSPTGFSTPQERMRIDSQGFVGIGTITPTNRLSVVGRIALFNETSVTGVYNTTDQSSLYVSDTSGSYPFDGAGNLIIQSQGNLDKDIVFVTGASATPRMFIEGASGKVTIGANAPGGPPASLYVTSAGGTDPMAVERPGGGVLINFFDTGAPQGNISVAGPTVSYNAFTGSHYGWTDEDYETGLLMTMTGENRFLAGNDKFEILYGMEATTAENDPSVIGTYLGILSPDKAASDDNPHLVMSVGNGYIWVADTGVDVKPGDLLISSVVAGHAIVDPGTHPESYVVARAAEPVRWDNVTATIDGVKHKRISVLFDRFVKTNFDPNSVISGISGRVDAQRVILGEHAARIARVEAQVQTNAFDIAAVKATGAEQSDEIAGLRRVIEEQRETIAQQAQTLGQVLDRLSELEGE
ncbi:MAG: hypothetical protein NUW37_16585, partial [Planctomycetes bacterium]|nr:hypothetical protein [Planctomycetota bacterium]